MIWQSLNMLNWLWVLPVFVLMFVYAGIMRRRGMATFAALGMQERLLKNVSFVRRRWKQVMILAALCLTVLALARPAWNPVAREVSRKGRDVVFVLDVSRSMLADDLQPNRLERAKIAHPNFPFSTKSSKVNPQLSHVIVFGNASVGIKPSL